MQAIRRPLKGHSRLLISCGQSGIHRAKIPQCRKIHVNLLWGEEIVFSFMHHHITVDVLHRWQDAHSRGVPLYSAMFRPAALTCILWHIRHGTSLCAPRSEKVDPVSWSNPVANHRLVVWQRAQSTLSPPLRNWPP